MQANKGVDVGLSAPLRPMFSTPRQTRPPGECDLSIDVRFDTDAVEAVGLQLLKCVRREGGCWHYGKVRTLRTYRLRLRGAWWDLKRSSVRESAL